MWSRKGGVLRQGYHPFQRFRRLCLSISRMGSWIFDIRLTTFQEHGLRLEGRGCCAQDEQDPPVTVLCGIATLSLSIHALSETSCRCASSLSRHGVKVKIVQARTSRGHFNISAKNYGVLRGLTTNLVSFAWCDDQIRFNHGAEHLEIRRVKQIVRFRGHPHPLLSIDTVGDRTSSPPSPSVPVSLSVSAAPSCSKRKERKSWGEEGYLRALQHLPDCKHTYMVRLKRRDKKHSGFQRGTEVGCLDLWAKRSLWKMWPLRFFHGMNGDNACGRLAFVHARPEVSSFVRAGPQTPPTGKP